MRFSLRVYRLLLKLYPASFREDYHAPLQQQFRDELVDVTGPRALARFWARTLWDFALSMPVQLAREVGQDSRHALRLWRQRPAHTLFAIAVLAIAIGATTGVFSVLNAVLLRSLPFSEPDRLAVLRNFGPPRNGFHDWRRQSAYLEDATTYDSFEINLEGVHQAARRRLTETSWNFFSVLGRGPALGRGFAPGEDTPGQTGVAVLSHSTWQQLFGGDPRAIGSTVRVNGTALTVIGIAPAGFDYPDKTDLWAPTTFDFERVPKTGSVIMWTTIGRLKAGMTWAQAAQAFEAEAAAQRPSPDDHGCGEPPGARPSSGAAGWPGQDGIADPHGWRRAPAPARMRECRQPAARTYGRAIERAHDPDRARREPCTPHAATADRGPRSFTRRNRRRPARRELDERARDRRSARAAVESVLHDSRLARAHPSRLASPLRQRSYSAWDPQFTPAG